VHQAALSADSRENAGSVFRIVFPLIGADRAQPQASPAAISLTSGGQQLSLPVADSLAIGGAAGFYLSISSHHGAGASGRANRYTSNAGRPKLSEIRASMSRR